MNLDRPRVPIGGGKTIDTTREVMQIFDQYIPPMQKTLILSAVIADFAAELKLRPAHVIKQFYDRLFNPAPERLIRTPEALLQQCLRVIEGKELLPLDERPAIIAALKELLCS